MNSCLRRLTPFRFIAALLVVIFHFGTTVTPFNQGLLSQITHNGFVAVSFFFCLSGFIMASVYQKPMNALEKKKYWLARFARIYPVYLLALFLMVLAWGFTQDGLILNIFLLQAWIPGYALSLNVPGWSLSVEVLFYLLFPFLTVWLSPHRLRASAIASVSLWIVTQFLTSYLSQYSHADALSTLHQLIHYFPLMHLNEFLLGCVTGAAFQYRKQGFIQPARLLAAAIVLVVTITTMVHYLGLIPHPGNGLYVPIFLAFIWIIASLPRIALLEHPFLVLLGESSYALYLMQMPVMLTLSRYLPNYISVSSTAQFYISVAVLIFISLFIYMLLERPARAFIQHTGRRILDRRDLVISVTPLSSERAATTEPLTSSLT